MSYREETMNAILAEREIELYEAKKDVNFYRERWNESLKLEGILNEVIKIAKEFDTSLGKQIDALIEAKESKEI